jgi:DNA-binding beta-propeller fold protein YncE
VGEGAAVSPASHDHDVTRSTPRCPPAVCVVAVLGDALHRMSILGGREGWARSLGSVYAGSVARFLGTGLRGVESRVIAMPGVRSLRGGIAVSRDGSTLLVSDWQGGTNAIHEFSVADGSRRRIVGRKGDGPLQFNGPCQVWIASDDFVFVSDMVNDRVQVLTPQLDFHAFVGVGQLHRPAGVCANDDVIVVADGANFDRLGVFNRVDGALLRWIGGHTGGGEYPPAGRAPRQIGCPTAVCFTHGGRNVAVAEFLNERVSVFSLDGSFIRHVGVGVLGRPYGVACSDYNEIIVPGGILGDVVVFSDTGKVLKRMGCSDFCGVATHGGTIFAQAYDAMKCTIFN